MIFVYFLLQISAIDAFGLINIFNMKGHGVPSDAFVEDIPQLNGECFYFWKMKLQNFDVKRTAYFISDYNSLGDLKILKLVKLN